MLAAASKIRISTKDFSTKLLLNPAKIRERLDAGQRALQMLRELRVSVFYNFLQFSEPLNLGLFCLPVVAVALGIPL